MPIVFTPDPTLVTTLSPGQLVNFTSDFIGPLPVGSVLNVILSKDVEGLQSVARATIDTHQLLSGVINVMSPNQSAWFQGQWSVTEGQPIHLLTTITEPGVSTPVDSGSATYTWAPSSNVASLIPARGSGQGLTADQAQQLLEIHQSTFPAIAVDSLTLIPLNTTPSNGPINAVLPNPTFGIIVRIANVPPELVPNTPDGDYWLPSLAVVRIFRGADLWKRVPIHTSSKLVELLDESIVAGLTAITATQWLLDLSVQVTFREGVTGQVFTMLLP